LDMIFSAGWALGQDSLGEDERLSQARLPRRAAPAPGAPVTEKHVPKFTLLG